MERAGSLRPLLLLLLSLIPFSYAQFTSPCASCALTDIYLSTAQVSDTTATVNATLIATMVDYSQPRERTQQQEGYGEAIEGQTLPEIEPSPRSAREILLSDADIFFYFVSPEYSSGAFIERPIDLPGCSPATTNQEGVASCPIDYSVFRGKCIRVYAAFRGTPQYYPSSSFTAVCDAGADAFSAMAGVIASQAAAASSQPLCLVGMVILGLMLASMFFTGRSPLSLLDITTPLLPKPKSISYSGLTYGTGYIRMARELDSIRKLSEKNLGIHARNLKEELLRRGRTSAEINELLSLAKDRPHMAYLALRALREGRTFAEARNIAKLKPVPGNDKDLEAAGRWINELQKRRKEKDLALEAVWLRVSAELQKKEIGLITGAVPPKVIKVRDFILDKTPLRLMPERIRDQLKVGIGSAFFGVRSAAGVARQFYLAAPARAIGKPELVPMRKEEKEARQFYLMDIRSRIENLYRTQIGEAKTNAAMYLVKRMLEAKGVKLELSEKDLLGLGNIEILSRMNLKANPAASAIEKKIREILSTDKPMDEKVRLLSALASRDGIPFDRAGMDNFMARLSTIDRDPKKTHHDKLSELQDFLRQYADRKDFRAPEGGFYPWVGRDSLRYVEGGRTVYDDTWTFLFLRSFLEQNSPGAKGAGWDEVAKLLWLRLVNETWSLLPSDTKGLREPQRGMMSQAEAYLKSLLTNEGREALKGLKSVFELLYNPAIAQYKGLFVGSELAREYGPNPAHWNMDVRGYWRVFVPGSGYLGDVKLAKTSVMEQAHAAIERAHIRPRGTMEEIARDMFYSRIRSLVGSRYPDAYYTARSEFDFLASAYGAIRERYAQMFGRTDAQRKDSSWVTDEQVKKFIKDGITLDALQKFVWVRTREGSYIPYTEGRDVPLRMSDGERIINGKLAVNMGGRWMEFNPLTVSERMKSEKIELPELLKSERLRLMNDISNAPTVQEGMYKRKIIDAEMREQMLRFARDLGEWAKAGNRQDVAAHLLLQMSREAGDTWALEKSGLLSIRPIRDVEYVGLRKTMQKIWQPVSRGFEQAAVSAFLPQINDLNNLTMNSEYFRARSADFTGRYVAYLADRRNEPSLNSELERSTRELISALSRYRAAWDETITRDPRGNSSSIGQQLNFASMYHHGPALHPPPASTFQQFTGRTFREFSERLRFMPLSINWLLGAPFILQVRGALTSWYGWPGKHDKTYHPLHPYEMAASRTLEGMRSLFDPFYAALDFTSGGFRKVGALTLSPFQPFLRLAHVPQSLEKTADFLRTSDSTVTGYIGKGIGSVSDVLKESTTADTVEEFYLPYYVKKSAIRERLTGPMTLHEYGGKSMQDGIVRTHEDHAWTYKNINVIWNVNTNPGVSYLDFYYQMQADPRLATHLVAGARFRSFFAQDEYLQKQANLGIIQREVPAYELAEAREEELRYYGPRSNRMWGFLNPITFFYNNPIPLLSYLTYTGVTKSIPEKLHDWAEKAKAEEPRYADLHSPPKTFMQGLPTGTASASIPYSTLQPAQAPEAETVAERFVRRAGRIASAIFRNTQFVSCVTCHSPVPRGHDYCPVCSGKSLISQRAQKPWAQYGPRGTPGGAP
ncbi:MAG: hypothetical protein AB1657_05120 [Candidatus Micrarchaeota archaeon]